MKSLLPVIIILALSTKLHGQSNQHSDKYEILLSMVRKQYPNDAKKLHQLAKEAHTIALESSDTVRIIESSRIVAQVLQLNNRMTESIEILANIKALAVRHNRRTEIKKINELLGIAYSGQNSFQESLQYYFESLVMREDDKDTADIANVYYNIGLVYFRISSFADAREFFQKALDYDVINSDTASVLQNLSNIGQCYRHLKKYDESLKYLDSTINLYNNRYNETLLIFPLYGIGLIHYERGNIADGIAYLNKSYEIAKKHNDKLGVIENLYHLGKIHLDQHNLIKAEDAFKELIILSDNVEFEDFKYYSYKNLYKIYKETGKLEQALSCLEKFASFKEMTFAEKQIENASQLKADYLQRKNLATIQAHASTIAQQKKINLQLIVIVGLCVLVLIVFAVHMVITKRINRELKQAQDLIHDQNRQLEVRNRELDKLVDQKTHELKHVNLTLKKMNDELAIFIDHIAKDICAPLATLKGICNVALIDVKDNVTSNYIKIVDSISEQLHTKLNRLLAINKIHQSRINASSIDLKTLVDEVIANYWKRGLPKNILLRKTIMSASPLSGDHELLTTILENLIDNAVKTCVNSPKENHFIELKVSSEKNGRVCFQVINNGLVMDAFDTEAMDLLALDAPFHKMPVNNPYAPDLYVIKSAVKKVGGKLDMDKTPEGYNVLSVVV